MRISTGISGLDHILKGGFLAGRAYLVFGEPGTGKTTLGLQFLAEGTKGSDPSSPRLLITFGQNAERIRSDAALLGLNVDKVPTLDFTPPPETFTNLESYDVFSPAEVEREPVTHQISDAIQKQNPQRIFVDSFSCFRNLATDAFHHRRLVQSFFRYATLRGATLLVAADDQDCARDVDGVIHLECGPQGRTIRVTKFRGSDFHAGHHPMLLSSEGLKIPLSAA